MNLNYIDIHSHLNLSPLLENKDAVLMKMKEQGIGTITVGTTLKTSRQAIEIAEQNPELCWATVGIHPCEIIPTPTLPLGEGWGGDILELETLASHPSVVAIGETGLDYFRLDKNSEAGKLIIQEQKILFKKHIELARQVNKPLMLHVRASKGSDDVYYDALEMLGTPLLQGEGQGVRFANFHFFSGSKKCMEDIVSAGFMISVDGPITFSNDYDDMIRACPLGSLMIETDAPFAAPAPHRGKTCEPWMVVEVCKKIAEIKGLEEQVVRLQVLENTLNFFRLTS